MQKGDPESVVNCKEFRLYMWNNRSNRIQKVARIQNSGDKENNHIYSAHCQLPAELSPLPLL